MTELVHQPLKSADMILPGDIICEVLTRVRNSRATVNIYRLYQKQYSH